MRRRFSVFPFLLAAVLTAMVAATSSAVAGQHVVQGHARAIDGDTLVIDGLRIRLEAVDAPELRQECQDIRTGARRPCGLMAQDALANMIAGQSVSCHLIERDHYGRFIGRCHIAGRFGGHLPIGRDLSAALVAQGWAVSYMADGRPDILIGEQAARARGINLWSMRFQSPEDYRRAARRA